MKEVIFFVALYKGFFIGSIMSKFMKRAIEIASYAKENVYPNPKVGAVIVKDNFIISEGYHELYGSNHAEINALNKYDGNLNGATLYVTLEPCNHIGKTPPCTDAIIDSGINKVIIGTVDPNPKVSGSGIKRLKDSGIAVECGCLEEECLRLNKHYNFFMKYNKPFITSKMALSLDGKYSTDKGESKWITSKKSRLDVHNERSKYQSILVGVQTIIEDNPRLNVRDIEGFEKQPTRIVLDTNGRIPIDSNVLNDELSTIIFTANMKQSKQKKIENRYNKIIFVETKNNLLDLDSVLKQLSLLNIQSVLVEGGRKVHESFIRERKVNSVIVYMASKFIGGINSLNNIDVNRISNAITLKNTEFEIIENDIKVKGDIG
tara:strand:+ start:14164 stop:15291 length:1128 start_codon:yes stop_codon:yes gene_type:complete